MSFNDYLGEEQTFVPAKSFAAGVTIIYNNKILLVHPTGASWQRGTCGIPKGGMETGENPMEAALRELREETGIQLNPAQLNPSPENVEMHTKRGKVHNLIYFVCQINDLSEIGLSSDRVPNSQLQLEEVDWAKFVSPEEAYPITSRSQLIILDRHLSLGKNK